MSNPFSHLHLSPSAFEGFLDLAFTSDRFLFEHEFLVFYVFHFGFPYMNTDRPYCFSEQILTLFMWAFSICLVMRVQSLCVSHKNFKLMESNSLFKIGILLLLPKSQSTYLNSFVNSNTTSTEFKLVECGYHLIILYSLIIVWLHENRPI